MSVNYFGDAQTSACIREREIVEKGFTCSKLSLLGIMLILFVSVMEDTPNFSWKSCVYFADANLCQKR